MRSLIGVFAALFFLVALRPAWATEHLESLNQEEVVQIALAHHPQIERAQAKARQAQARLEEAKRWFRPNISVYAGERLDTEGHRVGVQFSQDLDSLWDRSRQRQAAAELEIVEQDLALTRQSVVSEAVAAYSAWDSARTGRQRAELRVRRFRAALKHLRGRYEEGLATQAQVRRLEESLEEAERSQGKASGDLMQAAVRLRQAMGELGSP